MHRHRSRGLTPLVVSLLGLLSACAGDGPTAASQLDLDGLPAPQLPATLFAYRDAGNLLPAHFSAPGPDGSVASADNASGTNPITDAGATLGRVLFYDVRLSANNTVSCASCHLQSAGFGDTARFSRGLHGGTTPRHSMALANARYYVRGRFMHDGRFSSLRQVVDHYSDLVRETPGLDPLLRNLSGLPQRLNLSPAQRDALVAYLQTLTDRAFLTDMRFADPFRR